MKLPKNYGRNCFIAMIVGYILSMIVGVVAYATTGDVAAGQLASNTGTIATTFIACILVLPCIINRHSKED